MKDRLRRRRLGFAFYLLLSVAYLAWRGLFTLNPESPIYSVWFFVLEIYATACSVLFYAVILDRRGRTAPPAPAGRSVDVLICTYNESLDLVRQTVRRALAMSYPHRTFLLDDGNRPEARALAEALGCNYLARGENLHYKAGNLNHALAQTDGELLVILDADHLVRREFLSRLVGYFDDPQVALVQTPQVFYNIDSFQHHFNAAKNELWHEGAIFHHAMQPGADRWNAAFFVGTGAIVRRSAIEKIGGFATGSVTEDAYTCMRLHAASYRSVYHDEPLAYLLAPESLIQYLVQRLRWGQGSMQILRRDNPLTVKGLSWRQRLVYFTALSSFGQAIVHLAYYLAPAVFLLGGPAPLRASRPLDFAPIVAHILVDVVTFKLFLGPLARPLLAECFKFLNVYTYLKALGGLFASGRLRFRVTPKGRDTGASLRLLAPQFVLLLLNLAAFGQGFLQLVFGGHTLDDALGLGLATSFTGLFVVIGGMTLVYAYERIATHADYSFADHVAARLDRPDLTSVQAVAVRVNETSVHLVVARDSTLEIDSPVTLYLDLEPNTVPLTLSGRVQAVHGAGDEWVVRVDLAPLTLAAKDRLFDRFAEQAMPRVIDPLVRPWDGEAAATATVYSTGNSGAYYLPLESNVL